MTSTRFEESSRLPPPGLHLRPGPGLQRVLDLAGRRLGRHACRPDPHRDPAAVQGFQLKVQAGYEPWFLVWFGECGNEMI